MINYMNEKILILFVIFSISLINPVYSQVDSQENSNELIVNEQDLIIVFSIFIAAVIAIFLYLARHQILRKKLEYDKGEFESKKEEIIDKSQRFSKLFSPDLMLIFNAKLKNELNIYKKIKELVSIFHYKSDLNRAIDLLIKYLIMKEV